MRIGIDFDGVIADTIPVMVAYAREEWNLEISPQECLRPAGPGRLGEACYEALVRATHETPLALSIPPTPGAVESIAALATRHELFVVTNREGAALRKANEWLERWGIGAAFDDVRQASNGVGKWAAANALRLDALLDDALGNLSGLSAATRAFCWSATHNRGRKVPSHCAVMHDWVGFLAACEASDGGLTSA